MKIADFLPLNGVLANLKISSKKQLLHDLSAKAAELTGLHERRIFEVLLERERLGSTGVGEGVAIPHGKFSELEGLFGLFAQLHEPVDFESVDERPVDLVFLLLAPEAAGADHLKALARVSRLLRDETTCERLRGSDSAEALYALLIESAEVTAA